MTFLQILYLLFGFIILPLLWIIGTEDVGSALIVIIIFSILGFIIPSESYTVEYNEVYIDTLKTNERVIHAIDKDHKIYRIVKDIRIEFDTVKIIRKENMLNMKMTDNIELVYEKK